MTRSGRLLLGSLPLVPVTSLSVLLACGFAAAASAADSGVAVLLVDTDRVSGTVDERIYGHFLEHINHSVVDGLYVNWSETLIDLAGQNFDILGSHNYEYEPENYATGVRRIEDYLEKLVEYVRRSAHPGIEIAVLEWGSCRTYDWRAGLHAAGSLLSYEKLSPALALASPALLMRNTTDDPEWRAWIYHDHVSWFAGSGYVAEKLFRDYYAPRRLAFVSGTFKDIPRRAEFFDAISQMKPEDWTPNTVDAIATATADGRRLIIKAVNYDGAQHTLLTRVQGSRAPAKATVTLVTVTAGLDEANSLAAPDKLRRLETTRPYARDMAFELPPTPSP